MSRPGPVRSSLRVLTVAVVMAGLAAIPSTLAQRQTSGERGRFSGPVSLVGGPADWVTFFGPRGAFGAGGSVTLLRRDAGMGIEAKLQLPHTASAGLLLGTDLYLVEQLADAPRLSVLDLTGDNAPVPIDLDPTPRGALRLAQMDDYLLIAEDGLGLRVLRLPHPHGSGEDHAGHGELVATSLIPMEGRLAALAASGRSVFVAVDDELVIVDAAVPGLALEVDRLSLDAPVLDIAANGSTLFLLEEAGLRLVELDERGAPSAERVQTSVRGHSLVYSGRTLYLASGADGLRSVEDRSPQMATIFIQVGDVFFNPPGLVSVNQGDTVTWQKPATIFTHNVFSCNPAQIGCGGASATETFTSGAVTTSPFSFSHVFTVSGNNPYVCQSHNLTMQGNILVNAVATSPPGVADGRSATTPMRVGKLIPSGADLRLFYDPGACGADANDHNILFGAGSQLPTTLGGTYGIGGNACNIGTASPFDWIASPAAPAGGFLWWLVVADDGGGKEGSWSGDSAGGERTGAGVNGSSGRCGNTDKDLSNTCPP